MILLIHHRLHPNLEGFIHGVKANDIKLMIITPDQKPYDGLTSSKGEFIHKQIAQITFSYAFKLFKSYNFSNIIYRHNIKGHYWILLMSYFFGVKIIEYDQSTHRNDNIFKQSIRPIVRLFQLRPLKKWTPVNFKHSTGKKYIEPFSFFVRIPMLPIKNINKTNIVTNKIMMIGKLSESRKNHLRFIEELYSLNAQLIIVGSTPHGFSSEPIYYNLLQSQTKKYKNISLIKNASRKEVFELYSKVDIFVMPSSQESLGYSVLEAMSMGCVVVCNKDVGASCYIDDKINGFIFDINKKGDLENIVRNLIKYNLDEISLNAQNTINLSNSISTVKEILNIGT